MPQVCKVCQQPDLKAIDQALVAGTSPSVLAARYSTIDRMSFQRHKENHLPKKLAKAQEAREVAQADDILAQLKALRNKAMSILLKAEQAGDYRTALAGVREARSCLELLAELEGELDRRPQVNILISSEWLAVRDVIMATLAHYPEARATVASHLLQLEARNG